jgi:hypothetical protein
MDGLKKALMSISTINLLKPTDGWLLSNLTIGEGTYQRSLNTT